MVWELTIVENRVSESAAAWLSKLSKPISDQKPALTGRAKIKKRTIETEAKKTDLLEKMAENRDFLTCEREIISLKFCLSVGR